MLARSRTLAAALVGACVVGAPVSTHAGQDGGMVLGDRFGPIVAQQASAVRVDRGTLSFAVADDLASAEVTATYELTNAGPPGELEVAFVVVRGHESASQEPPHADDAISIDGSSVAFTVIGEVEMFEPPLDAWLAANPAIEAALRERATGLPRLVAAAGGRCDRSCDGLVWWYREAHGAAATEDRAQSVVRAAQEAIPAIVEPMTRGWSTPQRHGRRRMEWLRFRLALAAGQARTVTVRYTHLPDTEIHTRANPTFIYEHLLAPARSWAGFGPLTVAVEVPRSTRFSSSSPFHGEGDHHRAVLPEPSDGALRFELMALRGLWFGVADRAAYWAVFTLAAALTTLAVGRAAARHRARRGPGPWRTIAHALGSGLLATLATVAVVAVLLMLAPSGVRGSDYSDFSPFLELALLGMLSGLIGVAVSLAAASRADDDDQGSA